MTQVSLLLNEIKNHIEVMEGVREEGALQDVSAEAQDAFAHAYTLADTKIYAIQMLESDLKYTIEDQKRLEKYIYSLLDLTNYKYGV